jgi:hypothetical protein
VGDEFVVHRNEVLDLAELVKEVRRLSGIAHLVEEKRQPQDRSKIVSRHA